MNRDAFAGNLSHRWTELAGKYSADTLLIDTLFIEIQSAYNSSLRHYHTLTHIESLLNLSDQYDSSLHDKEIVDFAIFYHDIIYDVPRSDNEERSALLAEDRLGQLKLPGKQIVEIVRYILASKTHQLSETHREADLAWFLDFDMSILGSDWEVYRQYLQEIREEYITYPDMMYATGRSEFLRRTISMPFIFNTSQFRTIYEQQARANMQKELSLLTSK